MIAAVSWIPKGVAKSVPEVAEPPSKEEIEEMVKSGILERSGDDENEEDNEEMDVAESKELDEVAKALVAANALGTSKNTTGPAFADVSEALNELNMDDYDDEDDGIEIFGSGQGDTYYPSNEADPYLKDKDDYDSEEIEDITIKAEDSVVVCARNEDEVSHLEIWILEDSADGESNMYVHHDIIIPAFPLCTAWLDCPIKGGEKGNFIAVGSMEPAIEIWDLDILDEVQPSIVLGGVCERRRRKKPKYKKDGHTDAVLGLSWNKEYRNILASASADKLVKIWDVATGECNITMDHHTDKVQSVAWNQFEPQVLLSGSFDHTVVMKDGRIPSHAGFKWEVTADVESLAWDPHNQHAFVASLEDGTVMGFDIRAATSNSSTDIRPTFTLHAHDKAVSSVCYNPKAPNLLATASTDKMVKLWDLSNNQPSCVATNNPQAGAVFSILFSEDLPFMLAIGGSKGKLELWDTSNDAGISRRFGKYIKFNNKPAPAPSEASS
jgi:periodic tryptophan protein 1